MFQLAPPTPNLPEPQLDLEKLEVFKADQARDLEYAWRLLNSPFRAQALQLNAQLLMIEIGQRLENSVLLAQALDQLEVAISEPINPPQGGQANPFMGMQMEMLKQ